MVVLVVLPSFMLFGYNNGSTGHATDLESFVKVNKLQAPAWVGILPITSNSPESTPSTPKVLPSHIML